MITWWFAMLANAATVQHSTMRNAVHAIAWLPLLAVSSKRKSCSRSCHVALLSAHTWLCRWSCMTAVSSV
jgi:hypothetical protein